eukprot:scaffold6488_cov250-Isochrysis_galbana.AAC.1
MAKSAARDAGDVHERLLPHPAPLFGQRDPIGEVGPFGRDGLDAPHARAVRVEHKCHLPFDAVLGLQLVQVSLPRHSTRLEHEELSAWVHTSPRQQGVLHILARRQLRLHNAGHKRAEVVAAQSRGALEPLVLRRTAFRLVPPFVQAGDARRQARAVLPPLGPIAHFDAVVDRVEALDEVDVHSLEDPLELVGRRAQLRVKRREDFTPIVLVDEAAGGQLGLPPTGGPAKGLVEAALVMVVPKAVVFILAADINHNFQGLELLEIARTHERNRRPALELAKQKDAQRLVGLEGARVRADGLHRGVTRAGTSERGRWPRRSSARGGAPPQRSISRRRPPHRYRGRRRPRLAPCWGTRVLGAGRSRHRPPVYNVSFPRSVLLPAS